MNLTAQMQILLGGAALLVAVVAFTFFIWRSIHANRSLRLSGEQLLQRESELKQLSESSRELELASHKKELELSQVNSERDNLKQRLDESTHQQARLEEESTAILTAHSTLRDELSRVRADHRGLSVELEQLKAQLSSTHEQLEKTTSESNDQQERYNSLLNEHTQLQTQHEERDGQHREQIALLNDNKENLKREFENLANKIFEDKGKSFTSTSKASLDALLMPFKEQIAGFQTRVNEVHTESVRGQSSLEAEIKKVLDVGLEMNSQASNLTLALKGDKKTTGNWGEAQLERSLQMAGLQSGDHYDTQIAFRDDEGKRKLPDFIIRLPDKRHLIIDSKVSLVDYDRAIAAETEEQQTTALDAHAKAVRNHIDDLASKDYSNLPELGSPDFVLMFMPIEPAYIEAMKHNKDLFNYGYNKGVIMVSHSTLMPILRTVANLWKIEQSNTHAREISAKAGDIYNQVCLVAERLNKLGNTLRAANNHYNDAVKGLAGKQGLHGKVDRFRQLSSKASKEMAAVEPIHSDLENDRLTAVIQADEPEGDAAALELKSPI